VLLTLPVLAVAQSSEPRLETGVFCTFAKLERIGSTDHGVGSTTAGLGGRIAWRVVPHIDLDGELSVHPRAGVSGYRLQGFAGALIRLDVGETLGRYDARMVSSSQVLPPRKEGGFATRNRQWSVGVGKKF
jgi:hypothetical protein